MHSYYNFPESSVADDLIHDSASRFERFAQEQCENIQISGSYNTALIKDLDEVLAQNLGQMNYVQLLPIQGYSTSVLLSGENLLVYAPTGSGKTAAFLIPAIELVIRHNKNEGRRADHPLVLILGNTNNLMLQTFKFACAMAGYDPSEEVANTHVRIFNLFAGSGMSRMRNMMKIDHEIVIATCGGVLQAFMYQKLDLSNLKMLVIDEADKMVDESRGFGYEVAQIFSHVPKDVIVAEFSATFCEKNNQIQLSDLDKKLFRKKIPVSISILPPRGYITQRVIKKSERVAHIGNWTQAFNKDLSSLVRLIESDLNFHKMKKGGPYQKSTVIFVERRITSNYLALFLQQQGYDFEPVNSKSEAL